MKLLLSLLFLIGSVFAAKPVINFNFDDYVLSGNVIDFDASSSFDPDGGDLTYQWKLIASPIGGSASFQNQGNGFASFTPTRAGAYGAELIVQDSQGEVTKSIFSFSAAQTSGQIIYGPETYTIDILCKLSFGLFGCNERVYNFSVNDPNLDYTIVLDVKKIDNLLVYINGEQVSFYPDVSGADHEIISRTISLQNNNEIMIQSSGVFGSEIEFSIQESSLFPSNNNAPIGSDQNILAVSGNPKDVLLDFTDPDNGDVLFYEIVEDGFFGNSSLNGNVLTYVSENNFQGTDEVFVRAFDSGFPSKQVIVRISFDVSITSNTPPFISMNNLVTNTEDVTGLLTIIDTDPVDITINNGVGGQAFYNPVTNEITYQPNDNYTGIDIFEVVATDNFPGNPSSNIFVSVTVNPNTTPTLNDLNLVTSANSFVDFELFPNAEDANQTIALAIEVNPSNGIVELLGNNIYRYTPNTDYFGADTIQFRLTDSGRNNNTVVNNILIDVQQNGNQSPVILPSGFQAFKYNNFVPARVYLRLNEFPFDPDGDIVQIKWDFGDGNTRDLDLSIPGVHPLGIVYHIYENPGTYTIKVTIVDNEGAETSNVRDVTFTDTAGPSIRAFADKYEGASPLTVTFDGSLIKANNGTANEDLYFIWVLRDGTVLDGIGLNTITHTYQNDGNYAAYVIVRDGEHSFIKFFNINVGGSNPTPAPTAIIRSDRSSGTYPVTINFNAEDSIDANGNSMGLSYNWNFSDVESGEGIAQGKFVSHTFNSPGTYLVSMTVTDSNGVSSTQFELIHIKNPTYNRYQPYFFNVNGLDVELDLAKNWAYNPVSDSSILIDWGDGFKEFRGGQFFYHTYDQEGVYDINIQAELIDGTLVNETKTLDITSNSISPTFSAGSNGFDFQIPNQVTASLFSGDYDPNNSTILWDFSDRIYEGNAFLFDTINHAFTVPGAKIVEPVLTNEYGRSSLYFGSNFNAYVNSIPNLLYKYDSCVGTSPFTFTLDSSDSNDPQGIKSVQWHTFANNGEIYQNTSVFTETIIDSFGDIFPSLIIKDNQGDTKLEFPNIVVNDGNIPPNNNAPNLIIESFNNPNDPNAIDFFLWQSSDDEQIACYQVDLGNGKSYTYYGDFTYSYPSSGSYDVTITAFDNWGASTSQTISVNTNKNNYVLNDREKSFARYKNFSRIPKYPKANKEVESMQKKVDDASIELINLTLNKEI